MHSRLKPLFGTLSPWGVFWLYLGLASLAAAAGMSFMVGLKMTMLHALFLAVLSFVTAFIPESAYRAWNDGRKLVAIGLGFVSIPLFAVEFGQHAAYTAGIRGHEIATTKVQNVKWQDAQGNTTELRDNIKTWERRRDSLIQQNGWSATVTADALRARMASLNLAIDQEAARGGCKQRCLARTQERDEVKSRIAILEEHKGLDERIKQATDRLAELRDKAAKVEHKSSQTEHMNAFLSKAVALVGQGDLTPTEFTQESTQLSANLAVALAATGLPAICFFVMGQYRRREEQHEAESSQPRKIRTFALDTGESIYKAA